MADRRDPAGFDQIVALRPLLGLHSAYLQIDSSESVLIKGYNLTGRQHKAIEVWDSVLARDAIPTLQAQSSILDTCGFMGDLAVLQRVTAQIEAAPWGGTGTNVWTSAVEAYLRVERLDLALAVGERILPLKNVQPDIKLWNTLLTVNNVKLQQSRDPGAQALFNKHGQRIDGIWARFDAWNASKRKSRAVAQPSQSLSSHSPSPSSPLKTLPSQSPSSPSPPSPSPSSPHRSAPPWSVPPRSAFPHTPRSSQSSRLSEPSWSLQPSRSSPPPSPKAPALLESPPSPPRPSPSARLSPQQSPPTESAPLLPLPPPSRPLPSPSRQSPGLLLARATRTLSQQPPPSKSPFQSPSPLLASLSSSPTPVAEKKSQLKPNPTKLTKAKPKQLKKDH